MKRALAFALIAAATFVSTQAQNPVPPPRLKAPDRDPATWNWVVPEKIPGVTHATLMSASMKREIGFNVYLPPAYEKSPSLRFPVVYYLHGASGSERSALEFGDLVRRAIAGGEIGDVIYVFPNAGHYGGYRDWPDGRVMAETWIIKELIPHIDATHRTIAAREGRALSGWSMGGGGSLRFVLKYPEMFCAAATLSAALGYNENEGDTAAAHAKDHADAVRGKTGLFMVVGEDDGLYARHKPFLEELDALKITYTFKSQSSVGHNLGRMKELYGAEAVRFLAQHYAKAHAGQ
jgi:enterochelin esterase-like enzyme